MGVLEKLAAWFGNPSYTSEHYECSTCGTHVKEDTNCPECGGDVHKVELEVPAMYFDLM